jgi:hypothetical protein
MHLWAVAFALRERQLHIKRSENRDRAGQSTSDIDEALWHEAFIFTSLHFMTHDCPDGRLLRRDTWL